MSSSDEPRQLLQPWVQRLGLRHQGVLVSAVRGCDAVPRDDPSKAVVRVYRTLILNAHVGDHRRSASFFEVVPLEELSSRFDALKRHTDHLPVHYLLHLLHAVEIVGYHHPDIAVRSTWLGLYWMLCRRLHVQPETQQQLDDRLNAGEESFGRSQEAPEELPSESRWEAGGFGVA